MSASVTAAAWEAGVGRRRRSTVHLLSLALVWLTFAVSSIVYTEPSPYDVLMLGLIFLLPLVRLADLPPLLIIYLMLWLLIATGILLAVTQAQMTRDALVHSTITLFLSLSSVVIAGFIVVNPERHTRLILSGYMLAAVIATLAAIIGYFRLVPGAYELFTMFSRARGTFEDPNVYGPFITPMLLYAAYRMLVGNVRQTLFASALFALLLFGMLLTFSRGAWMNTGIAFVIFAFFEFVTAPTNRHRLKLVLFALFGVIVFMGVIFAALQIPAIAELYQQRTSLELGYDVGPQGRFGGQAKALNLIFYHPLGLGGLEFGKFYHPEDVHNVYLSMFLNAGWLGGLLYFVLVVTTLLIGARYVLRSAPTRGYLLFLLAAFAGLAGEGFVIDTDHWRHFFVLMGLIWGLVAAYPAPYRRRRGRSARADVCILTERNGRSGEI